MKAKHDIGVDDVTGRRFHWEDCPGCGRPRPANISPRFYDVWAHSVNTETGGVTQMRKERIDVNENELFRDCKGPWDVEDRYEHFWNRLNESWESEFPLNKDRVKVVRVEPVGFQ